VVDVLVMEHSWVATSTVVGNFMMSLHVVLWLYLEVVLQLWVDMLMF
jgi:hypothetical protein